MLHFRLLCALVLLTFTSQATAWDEPWADRVIKQSSTFLLARIVKSDPQHGVDIEVLRILGGKAVPLQLKITGFSLLDLCSSSGGGPEFEFEETDSCYFFISQDAKGAFAIATPTTGFSHVNDGAVHATYRHSYHQASVPTSIYELTMTAIFNKHHSLSYNAKPIMEFVTSQLSRKPSGFGEDEIQTFFVQHAALETIFHLDLEIPEERLLPFLQDTTNFHNQVSGARALAASRSSKAKEALMQVLSNPDRRNFVKVMCLLSLQKMNAAELKPQLARLLPEASDKDDDFGGNIMDHRICTSVPTVKEALQKLIDAL